MYIALGAGGLLIATAVNVGMVLAENRFRIISRRFGSRAWRVHLLVVGSGWAAALACLVVAGWHVDVDLPVVLRPFGVLVLAAGLWLVVVSGRSLGLKATLNGAVFGQADRRRVQHSVYRLLANPMYDGFAVILVGIALVSAKAIYLGFAAECWVLCTFVEAPVENRTLR